MKRHGLWVLVLTGCAAFSAIAQTASANIAEVDGSATDAQLISPIINLQGRIDTYISFSWFIKTELDSGEYLAFDISQDGGTTWIELRRLDGNVGPENTWRDEILDGVWGPAGTMRLRFRGKMSGVEEDAYIDNVRVIAQ